MFFNFNTLGGTASANVIPRLPTTMFVCIVRVTGSSVVSVVVVVVVVGCFFRTVLSVLTSVLHLFYTLLFRARQTRPRPQATRLAPENDNELQSI